jgi:decaprenylphospho-beta-D-erythro-pentofuranosid-2-ulose 2-reductase
VKDRKRLAIVGATSAIAEHCTRLWLQDGPVDLTLIGRDANCLERVAADLHVRGPQSVIRVVQAEFLNPSRIQATVDALAEQGAFDIVLIAHGFLPDQGVCQTDLVACREALEINGLSPVLYAEAFVRHMEKAGHGTLVLIGSVAGDRGRKSNYVYGAAKGLVSRYAQGLQHRLAGTGVSVVMVKPGPTDTPMTEHLKAKGAKLASVESVAARIVDAVRRGRPVVYAPRQWSIIMLIIQHLPKFIMKKLSI